MQWVLTDEKVGNYCNVISRDNDTSEASGDCFNIIHIADAKKLVTQLRASQSR